MLRGLVGSLLSLFAHRLAFLLPRRDDVWAFGSRGGGDFEGNSKYLFLHVAAREDLDVRPVWLSESAETVATLRRHGYDARRTDTLRGVATLLRAGYVFITGSFTDVPTWPTGGATVVQLWHGVPLKRISRDGPTYADVSLFDRLSRRYVYRQFDRIVVTGERLTDVFASAFGVARDRIVVTGYPRNDALFGAIPGFDVGQNRSLYDEIAADDGPTLAYLPTYRDGDRPPADAIDFAALDELLGARDATLLVKFHPFEQPDLDVDAFDNVRFLPAEFDVYPAFGHVDALVTDYSSIYFDFLLLDRPIVFYAYDRAAYSADHGFYVDYDTHAPGPIVTEFDGLLSALDRCLDGDDSYADERAAVREAVFDHVDGNAAARVVTAVTGTSPPAAESDRPVPGTPVPDVGSGNGDGRSVRNR
jgi:CDP-glycerol glycerophosphotransferase (TagB/SpsB family)